MQETYTIQYGTDLNSLDSESEIVSSSTDISEVNATYTIQLDGLLSATVYYFQVAATYEVVFTRYSEVSSFRTLEDGNQLPSDILQIHGLVFPLEQAYYLQFLPRDNTSVSLPPCDDCSSDEIQLPENLPIGGYFHQSAYVSFYEHVSINILEFPIHCMSHRKNKTSLQSDMVHQSACTGCNVTKL